MREVESGPRRPRIERGAHQQAVLRLPRRHGVRGVLAHRVVRAECAGPPQRGDARCVQSALDRLHVVAVDDEAGEVAVVGPHARPLELGELGRLVRGTEVGPDQPAVLDDAERRGLHLPPEGAVRRLQRQVEDVPVDVELPVAAAASDAPLLHDPEGEVRAAVRAARVQQAEPSPRVAKRDEVLAERLHPDGVRIRRGQFLREQDGRPEAAEEIAHRRLRPDAREQFVVFPSRVPSGARFYHPDARARRGVAARGMPRGDRSVSGGVRRAGIRGGARGPSRRRSVPSARRRPPSPRWPRRSCRSGRRPPP